MFFRKPIQEVNIEDIDFSQMPLISELDDSVQKEYYLPYQLHPYQLKECISTVMGKKNPDLSRALYLKCQENQNKLFIDPVIDRMYFSAIVKGYSVEEFQNLSGLIPFNINRPIHYELSGLCTPSAKHKKSLLEIAVAYEQIHLLPYFLNLYHQDNPNNSDALKDVIESTIEPLEKTLAKCNEDLDKEDIGLSNREYHQKRRTVLQEMLEILKVPLSNTKSAMSSCC